MTVTASRSKPIAHDRKNQARPPQARSALAGLLHALNQPLTGLQCSLELALSAPPRSEQYLRTIREGVELAGRMRELVQAMQELLEVERTAIPSNDRFAVQDVLAEVIAELRPVAETGGLQLHLEPEAGVEVAWPRQYFKVLAFRLIEPLLGLAAEGSRIGVAWRQSQAEIRLEALWSEPSSQRSAEFSRAELGLLLAGTMCQRMGGRWETGRRGERMGCTMWLPLEIAAPCGAAEAAR